MTEENAIRIEALSRHYGERVVLSELSFGLAAGKTVAVFGTNGAGKTTLLRVLATLLRPHSGSAWVFGHELPGEGYAVRGRIGYLGHEPLLYRDLSARENLRYYAGLYGTEHGRYEELLERVRLSGRADEPVRTLSRGMVQRIAICRCVLHRPELLLLDEPYANLDPGVSELVTELIGPHSGLTRVVTGHSPERELIAADFALGLRAGGQAFFAPAGDIGPGELRELYR